MLKRLIRIDAKVALSDDPRASSVIAQFATSTDPWIVAVRMISEGVDIPRLRVGVFATTTATPMFFRQAVGRIARWTPGLRSQRSYLFVPDDPRLRLHALSIAQARRHSIELRRHAREAEPGELDGAPVFERAEEQLSLFAALSATVVDVVDVVDPPADGLDPYEDVFAEPADLRAFTIDLPPPPPLPGRSGDGDDLPVGATRRGAKTTLRDRNAALVSDIARLTGLGHRAVNAELNRLTGIVRIDDATVEQLYRRAGHARTWLDAPDSFVVGRGAPPVPAAKRPAAPRVAQPSEPVEPTEPSDRKKAGSHLAKLRKSLNRE